MCSKQLNIAVFYYLYSIKNTKKIPQHYDDEPMKFLLIKEITERCNSAINEDKKILCSLSSSSFFVYLCLYLLSLDKTHPNNSHKLPDFKFNFMFVAFFITFNKQTKAMFVK